MTISPWDISTRRYVSAMAVRPSNAQIDVINNFIVGAKVSGFWQKSTLLCFLAGDTQQATLLNAVNPTQTLTAVNSPTFIQNGGWQGVPANSAYLEGPAWNNLVGLNNGFMYGSVTGGTNAANSSAYLFGQPGGTSYNTMWPRSGVNAFVARFNVSSTSVGIPSGGTIVGNILAVRDGNENELYKNGVAGTPVTLSPTQISTTSLNVFRHTTNYSDFRCPFIALGNQSLTAQQALDLHNLTQTYLSELAAL